MLERALLVAILATAPLSAAELFFSRTFPGSAPPYFDVTVKSDGLVAYREAPGEEPLEFQLAPAEAAELFAKAASLDFDKDLAIRRKKVAFTGDKVLRLRDGQQVGEARFVHTDDATAQELALWFLKVNETEQNRIELERTLRFDRLGVNDALLALETSMGKGRVIAPDQFLPILRTVAEESKLLQIARSRAAGLIERIEATSGATAGQ